MKISINWLKDYVNLDGISATEIADKLTRITCEVEEIEHKGAGLDGVVAGRVLTCVGHPKSDHLHLLTVDVGGGQPLKIVCGAPNVRAGMAVAVATVGTKLPNGLEIKESEIRGEVSQGMCCSYAELGYSADGDGIIELPDKAVTNGTSVTAIYPELIDDILNIDNKSITNRPDLWGHYGIARELAAIFGRKFKEVATDSIAKYDALPKLGVKIENDNCLSYGAVKIDNIGGIQSPQIIQNRLFYCGHSSHGFLVDITNYVMLLFGNPIHAFDSRTIGKISIGNIPAGSKFTTLKDDIISATGDMLFIKSDNAPVALAGIMGGKESGIKPDTKDVVFEVATFDAGNIRRTSAEVGIRSDASARYEKSLDPQTNFLAAAEILRLTAKYAKTAKIVSAFTRVTAASAVKKPQEIVVGKVYLEKFAGVKFNYKDVEKKLKALGFAPVITADEIRVTVPSYRNWKDVTAKADVVEEIVRYFGYENIKAAAPAVAICPVSRNKIDIAEDKIKDIMAEKYGYAEVHTNVWYDTRAAKALNIEPKSYLTVVNSFVRDDDKIRSEILTSMLTAVSVNKSQKDVRVCEIGRVIVGLDKNGNGIEEKHFGGAATGADYTETAHMLTDVFGSFGIKISYKLGASANERFHPKNNAQIFAGGKAVGEIGIIHPKVMEGAVGFAINLDGIDFNNVRQAAAPKLSKFPKTELDFTFIWDGIYAELNQIFDKFQNPAVLNRQLTGIFGNRYTLTFTVGSFDKTLTSAELGAVHAEIKAYAEQNGVNLLTSASQ
jgi:phenylalanyl-tRNA synthetase beta chain